MICQLYDALIRGIARGFRVDWVSSGGHWNWALLGPEAAG
jgi:hypothetical protein